MSYIQFGISLGLGSSTHVLECLEINGFHDRLVFWLLLPLALVALLCAATAIKLLLLRKLRHRPSRHRPSLHAEEPSRTFLSDLFYAALPGVLRLLFVLYPIVANVCTKEGGTGAAPVIIHFSVE